MSTNKTQNYQLHAWGAGDDFLRMEFNENFAAIDGLLGEMPANKKLKVVTGSYVGDGDRGRGISLGFRAKAVLALSAPTMVASYQALMLPGLTAEAGQLTENGFRVGERMNLSPSSTQVNGDKLNPYRYIAFDWEE